MVHSNHAEMIHDISFNFDGTRFASCSSDLTVMFYEKDENDNWVKSNELQCHNGPIWRVKWAHPNFG